MEPVTIELKHPVTFGAEVIDHLTFSRLVTLEDMKDKALGATMTLGDMAHIIGRLTGYDRQAIMRLEAEDVDRVIAAALPFFGYPRTGGSL